MNMMRSGPYLTDLTEPNQTRCMRAVLLLTEGANLLSVAIAADLLHAMKDHVELLRVALNGPAVTSSAGGCMTADHRAEALDDADLILVFGGDAEPARLGSHLRRVVERGIWIGAIGTAVLDLADAGLLQDRSFSIDGALTQQLAAMCPDLRPSPQLFCIDRGVATCPDGAPVVDLVLQLLQELFGKEAVLAVMRSCMILRRRTGADLHMLPASSPPKLQAALRHIAQNLARPDVLREAEELANISRRQLERMFRANLCTSPVQHLMDLRLRHARGLLAQTDHPVAEIAQFAGFGSATHFCKTYRRAYGQSPHKVDVFA